MAEERITIEKDPTPEKEAGQFQGKDETRTQQRNTHALNLLNAKKGYIDHIVGVINPSMNIALLLCAPILVIILALIILVAVHDKPERFSVLLDHAFRIFTLIIGVGIGAASARSKE